ncbi:2-hydroxyglutaryl-CoA dehydratase [Helicobacter monodelphidis]|uniref:2-hydroxyacyl-CoA dehydratase n=1 Tax=Helicobacter sp. 15-1451 TaxID=2004995 RepID=UPI000DCE5FBF|nr:2-hydroxyacyl-CoA dehydratase [Helicobacter sp. 15-1451]RAX58672.1 2-hydroxyglutaryl-CoA dehydratase [Helicobacter sp. 15-1451]
MEYTSANVVSWKQTQQQKEQIGFKEREITKIPFTKEMKETHTILVPMMLPIHFRFLVNILHLHGYKAELLHNDGKGIVDEGLRNVHNDTCYPALLVIGQMIDALKSGKWDLSKVALMITQTGGGCRASNYIYLLRKALNKAGYGSIPVISLNFSGLENDQGFSVSRVMLQNMLSAVIYGDLLMHISNQCKPYEKNAGDTDAMVSKWIDKITTPGTNDGLISYKALKKDTKAILEDFASIPMERKQKTKVGIVGEIYIKFSPIGNNNLEDFLLGENCEVVIPGFLDFCLYCINDSLVEGRLYGGKLTTMMIYKVVYAYFLKRQTDMIKAIVKHGFFQAPSSFKHTKSLANDYVSQAMNMGEGWLLTAEMLELIQQGVNNIVCTQPFGCLPNHIVGRGMMKVIKEKNPQSNIVSIDYDPGATKVNQENRIKLMLSNAKKQMALT